MGTAVDIYKKSFITRYDDNGFIKYYSAVDFPGLEDAPCSFRSGENTLSGHFYSYPGAGGTLVVFSHGIGGGHRSYMREIEKLCSAGYTVFAYDCTGCFESEGRDIRCMGQSLADLDAAFGFLETQGHLARFERVCAMGHSWGGYAAANIASCREGIDRAVVLSGFNSVESMLTGMLRGANGILGRAALNDILSYEKRMLPDYYGAQAVDSVLTGRTKYLFIQSDDDRKVSPGRNFVYIKMRCAGSDARFLICHGKNHNPNYTKDAVRYMDRVFGEFTLRSKLGLLGTIEKKKAFFKDTDWERMTRQDDDVWNEILSFLAKK